MKLNYSIDEGYDTKEPIRGSPHAAGLDVYVPEFTETFEAKYNELNPSPVGPLSQERPFPYGETSYNTMKESKQISIPGHCRVIIPTGLRFDIPEGTYLEVANRGSVAAKQGLIYGAHIIDEDYQGIVFINLVNTTDRPITVEPGTKLVQLIHKTYIKSVLNRKEPKDLYEKKSHRAEGALGSSGK